MEGEDDVDMGWPSWLCDRGTRVPKCHMSLWHSLVRTEMLTDANPRGPAHSYLLRTTQAPFGHRGRPISQVRELAPDERETLATQPNPATTNPNRPLRA